MAMASGVENLAQKKRLTISISQVAPLIGLDNYGNFPRIVCELWRRFNPSEFREFELRMKSAGYTLANSSEMNDIWEMDEKLGTNILEKVRSLNSNTGKTSADMTKSQAAISDYITQQTNLSSDKKAELIKKVCSITNKSHGVTNEDAVINEFCKLSCKTLQGTQGWVEIPLSSLGASNNISVLGSDIELEWVLVGKYDGITTDGELVEAKMRQKGLFKSMRDYENVQVQLYLHALGCPNGFLVEGFSKVPTKKKKADAKASSETDTKAELILYTHEVIYDSSYVNEIILARLVAFTKYFAGLMKDTSRKENLLRSDKSEWNKYIEEYLDTERIDF
jgi:hypothetical protein